MTTRILLTAFILAATAAGQNATQLPTLYQAVDPSPNAPGGNCFIQSAPVYNYQNGLYWTCQPNTSPPTNLGQWVRANPPVVPQIVTSAPTGSCSGSAIKLTVPAGVLYTCAGGVWTAAGGSTGSLPVFSVKSYGAVGNNVSHPACSYLFLGSLAELRAYQGGIYSFATSCSNQMDWLGSQAANVAAQANVSYSGVHTGGTLKFAAGFYLFDQVLIVPTNVDFFTPSGTSISITGDDESNTFIGNVSHFAAGTGLISCGDPAAAPTDNGNLGSGRYAALGSCFGSISNLTLSNPLATSFSKGVPPSESGTPVEMDGLLAGARMQTYRVRIQGFRCGMNWVGDHTLWDSDLFQNNEYGVCMVSMNKFSVGDLQWNNLNSSGNTVAGIWISKNTFLATVATGETYLGGNPYGFLAEPGVSINYGQAYAGTNTPMISGSTFDLLQAEWQGNAAIWDDNKTNSGGGVNAGARDIIATTIRNFFTSWVHDNGYFTGGRNEYAYIGLGTSNGLIISGIQPNSMLSGGTGQIAAVISTDLGYASGGIVLSGDMTNLTNNYGSANLELVQPGNAVPDQRYVRIEQPGVWSGGVGLFRTAAVGSLAAGVVLENQDFAGLRVAGGTQQPLGINMQAWSASPSSKYTVFADWAKYLQVTVTGTNTINSTLKAGASGTITAATFTGTEYMIGSSANTSGATAWISLNTSGTGGSGGSFTQPWIVTKVDSTHLSIALNSYTLNIAGTPCTNPPVPAVISNPVGTGTGFIYVNTTAGCVIAAGSNITLTGDANVTVAGGSITNYPPGSVPIATFSVTSNVFGTPTAAVTPYSAWPVLGGTNCSAPYSNGVVTVSCSPPPAPFSALTDGAAVTWDAGNALASNRTLLFTTHGGNRTLNMTNLVNGGDYVLRVKQDGTGPEGLLLGTGCTWIVSGGGSGAITLSTAANAVDVLAFKYDGTSCLLNLNKNFN